MAILARLLCRIGAVCLRVVLCAGPLAPVLAAETASDARTNDRPSAFSVPPAVLQAASQAALPLFQQYCAGCHGGDARGMRSKGAPNLVDGVWLWDDASIETPLAALEDTIRYGIRSGHPKARNVAVMPAFGGGGEVTLTAAEISDVVEYVRALAGQAVETAARKRGRAVFTGRGNCSECHSDDGSGNADWGAPDLRVKEDSAWLYGADRVSLTRSVAGGRAGRCPDWSTKLDAPAIHALALWLRAGNVGAPR